MAVVVYRPKGKKGQVQRWFVRDTSKDFHTHYGPIPKAKLKKGKVVVGNETFIVVPATFLDEYKGMKRKAQIITRKDLGFIVGYCGLTKDSVIVESGAGSGGATIMLAKLCKTIHSFEIDEGNIEVVKQNLKHLDITNAAITLADFYDEKSIKVKNADLVLLDLPEPWNAYASAKKAVKIGGYVVAYTPTILQAEKFVNNLPEEFLHERTTEVIDRDWKVQGQAVRPISGDIGHTAFLTFVRRIL